MCLDCARAGLIHPRPRGRQRKGDPNKFQIACAVLLELVPRRWYVTSTELFQSFRDEYGSICQRRLYYIIARLVKLGLVERRAFQDPDGYGNGMLGHRFEYKRAKHEPQSDAGLVNAQSDGAGMGVVGIV